MKITVNKISADGEGTPPTGRASVRIVAEEWTRAIVRMLWRIAIYATVIVGSIYILGRLRSVVIAIVVGVVLAYIIRPVATYLVHRDLFRAVHNRLSHHGRRGMATLYVVILGFVAVYGATRIIITPFVEEARNLATNYPKLQASFNRKAADLKEWYESSVPENTRKWIQVQLDKQNEGGGFNVGAATTAYGQDLLKTLAGSLKNIVEIVLLPVLAFYFALDSKRLKHDLVALLPCRPKEVLRTIHQFNGIMYSYVVGQAILCVLAGVLVGFFLWAVGLDYSLTLGVLAGITRAIPIIGPIFGGIPIVLLALITKGFATALWVLGFFTFMHFAESKFIMPKIIGDRMDLHPVVIIVVLLIGQEFGGLLGMFFAPPLAAIVRVIFRRHFLHRWNPRSGLAVPSSVETPGIFPPKTKPATESPHA